MIRLRSRITFANVMSVTAVFIALGAGAYAAEKVRNDSITTKKLDFPIGGDGVTKTTKLSSTGAFQTILKTKVVVNDKGGVMQIGGAVEVDNGKPAPVEVDMRALMNGKREDGTFTNTIPGSTTGTGLALFQCDEMPPGTYTVELQADTSSSVTFLDRTLSVETGPQI
jgi:hypothetical protein